jgi:hypothetical protein
VTLSQFRGFDCVGPAAIKTNKDTDRKPAYFLIELFKSKSPGKLKRIEMIAAPV